MKRYLNKLMQELSLLGKAMLVPITVMPEYSCDCRTFVHCIWKRGFSLCTGGGRRLLQGKGQDDSDGGSRRGIFSI